MSFVRGEVAIFFTVQKKRVWGFTYYKSMSEETLGKSPTQAKNFEILNIRNAIFNVFSFKSNTRS